MTDMLSFRDAGVATVVRKLAAAVRRDCSREFYAALFRLPMAPSRGAAFDSFDVVLDGVQRDAAHEHLESLLFRKFGLLERDRAPQGRFQREGGTGANV